MKRKLKLAGTRMLLAALLTSLFFVGTARAQAQLPAFFGKFTLPYQVRWGGSVLRPGDYTLTIKSTGSPMIALVRTAHGDAVTYVMNGSLNGHTNGVNALLITDRGGQLTVHALALADLGVVLIYDRSLGKGPAKEARVEHTIPVMSAKK
jgi:hypothetical protein